MSLDNNASVLEQNHVKFNTLSNLGCKLVDNEMIWALLSVRHTAACTSEGYSTENKHQCGKFRICAP